MEFILRKAVLRPWSLADADSLCLHANNINIANNLRNAFPHPYTLKDAIAWLKGAETNSNLLLAISIDGKAVGGIGLIFQQDIYKKNAEIGYWLSEDYWNLGIVTEGIEAVVRHAFKNLEIHRIYAGTFETNKASQRVLAKAGFHLEATLKQAIFKNGVYLDECILSILNPEAN